MVTVYGQAYAGRMAHRNRKRPKKRDTEHASAAAPPRVNQVSRTQAPQTGAGNRSALNVQEFVTVVDRVIVAPKKLVGAERPRWQAGRTQEEQRLKLPLEIDGEQRGQFLVIMAFPNYEPSPMFNIAFECCDKVVCRLDFDLDSVHGNNLRPRPQSLPALVHGPHWHSWELNRGEVRSILVYDKMPYAEPFTEAQKFDAVLRWYCGKRNIALGRHGLEFPMRSRLL